MSDTDPLQSTAVLIFVEVVILPEYQEVTEVLQDLEFATRAQGPVPGSHIPGSPSAGAPVSHESLEVLGKLVLLVGKHQEDQSGVQAADIFLEKKAHDSSRFSLGVDS